jgi:hypothetical protein
MSDQMHNPGAGEGSATRVDIEGGGWRFFAAGPALAVIAAIALIGMIIVSVLLIGMSERAIERATPSSGSDCRADGPIVLTTPREASRP